MNPVLRAREGAHVDVVGHGGNQLLDERGRLRSHEVGAQEPASGAVSDQFAQAGGVLHCPAIGYVPKTLNLHCNVVALFLGLVLRKSHRGNLRVRKDGGGDVLVRHGLQVLRVQQVVLHCALLRVGTCLSM